MSAVDGFMLAFGAVLGYFAAGAVIFVAALAVVGAVIWLANR